MNDDRSQTIMKGDTVSRKSLTSRPYPENDFGGGGGMVQVRGLHGWNFHSRLHDSNFVLGTK